jgi:hypothetical protein
MSQYFKGIADLFDINDWQLQELKEYATGFAKRLGILNDDGECDEEKIKKLVESWFEMRSLERFFFLLYCSYLIALGKT